MPLQKAAQKTGFEPSYTTAEPSPRGEWRGEQEEHKPQDPTDAERVEQETLPTKGHTSGHGGVAETATSGQPTSSWAMLCSNQRPLPCEGESTRSPGSGVHYGPPTPTRISRPFLR
jgi:hypothetical protein